MKCSACGKENMPDSRFCAFCGEKLAQEAPAAQEAAVQPEPAPAVPRQTARPLAANPYQPVKPILSQFARPAEPAAEKPAKEEAQQEEQPQQSSGPRQLIKPAPKRVFLFDEEKEEEEQKLKFRKPEPDEFADFEYDDEDGEDDIYDDEDAPSGGRIFVRIFSVLTVLILIVGVVSFLYGTTVGRRLLASAGMSSNAEDYLILADWQMAQNNLPDASDSYYNAFKLDQDNYELALTVGTGFEKAGDDLRAEQLYSLLITSYPQADEPYDRLMALLNRQGRISEYERMLAYRAEHQPGYVPPTLPAPSVPTASHESGSYIGTIMLTLEAGGAEIRYTLDGTAPGAESLLYTGPITLSTGTHNLRAVAIQGGQISGEWTASFVIS